MHTYYVLRVSGQISEDNDVYFTLRVTLSIYHIHKAFQILCHMAFLLKKTILSSKGMSFNGPEVH